MKGMVQISWDMRSVAKVISNLKKVNLVTKEGGKKGLKIIAKEIMAESKAEVPVDTFTLQSTAFIEQPKVEGNNVTIKMGYGGPNDKMNPDTGLMASQYANIVHDSPDLKHPYGKWKFLEDPLNRNVEAFNDIVGGAVASELSSRRL